MALPFFNSAAKKRDQIVAIDLGGRTTKGVLLQRRGESYQLANFTLHDAPISEKTLSPELLAEHLKAVAHALGARTKQVTLAIGVTDSVMRLAELPTMVVADMRLMLKHNSKTYLQQDLPDHVFDCYILPTRETPRPVEGEKKIGAQKFKVLVSGVKRQVLDDLQQAIKAAGLIPDQVVPGMLGPINAFELAEPEIFSKEVVALVDVGFRQTSISILSEGELVLNRVVGLGGDKMTSGLAESLGISYAEAEGIKVGMAAEVQSNLEPLLVPLGRELRASVAFFEHQSDKTVGQVFICGGAARSEYVLQCLQNELMVPCKSWNPAAFLQMALPPQQMGEIEQVAPQLTVAVGAAVCGF